MKKNRAICLLITIVLLFAWMVPAAAAASPENAPDQPVLSGSHSVDAAISLGTTERLTKTAKAVILYELNSDTMLYAYNADEKIYPSSMVKLMTALVALENGNMSDSVTVTKEALSHVMIGAVSAGLKRDEVITLRDLLYCMMTASANDAAVVIAEHIGGSQDGFIRMMNEKAQQLGCKNTHYSNAHGIHDDDTYTTARDICRIMDAAMENEDFRMLFSAKQHTVPETNKSKERVLNTTNYMMSTEVEKKYYDQRVTGGKTGATDKAGRCLALTAESNGMNVLCIVMGAEPTYDSDTSLKRFGSFEEAQVLLDYAFKTYEFRQVFFDGQIITQYPVEGGMNDVVVQPQTSASTVLPVDTDVSKLTVKYENSFDTLKAPLEKGAVLGTVQVWFEQKCLAQTNLVAKNAVEVWHAPVAASAPKDRDNIHSWTPFLMILGVLFGGVLLFGVVLLVIRFVRIRSRKAAHSRKREKRRRSR